MNSSDLASIVDPSWYLTEYPDVLDAGVDPIQHYVNHGYYEGRHPYLLHTKILEEKLWSGFPELALQDLEKMAFANDSLAIEASYAAWAAFRWYVSHFEWEKSRNLIEIIENSERVFSKLSFDVLKSRVLLELGSQKDLSELKEYFKENYQNCNDIDLAISNITACPHCASNFDVSCKRLSPINEIFHRSKLVSLALLDPHQPLSIDNICASSTNAEIESPLKVSIIMPAFNAASYIKTAIHSITSQTFKNFELLVVDDCSTDDTLSIIEQLQLSDARIKLFRHDRTLGAYAARNTALHNAQGFYITNHDADDWSHPQRIEIMVQSLQKNPETLIALADWVRATPSMIFGISKIHHGLIEPSVSTFIIKRDVLVEVGGWDEVRVAADSELLDRIKTLYGRNAVINACPNIPLVIARSIDTSLTNSVASNWKTDFYGMRKHYRTLYSAFHKRLVGSDKPFISRGACRMFPAPATNLMIENDTIFDFILIADFSNTYNLSENIELVRAIISKGLLPGLCHWPDYDKKGTADIAEYFVDLELDLMLKVLTCDTIGVAKHLVVLEPHLLEKPTSFIPKIRFQHCHLKTPKQLISYLDRDFVQDDSELIIASGEFWPDWYLLTNEDVRTQGTDPLHHFLTHGLQENRLPNPEFNSSEYAKQVSRLLDTGWSPFMHYLKIGRANGKLGNVNEFNGELEYHSDRPTILVTAHAAGKLLFGAERCLLDVIISLADLKFNIITTLPESSNNRYLEKLRALSVKAYVVPCAPWKGQSAPDDWAIDRFCQIIEANNVDVVLANTLTQREPLLAAKSKSIKSILYVHESPQHDPELCSRMELSSDSIIQQIENLADTIWVTSEYSSSSFSNHAKVHVVGNVIDSENFDIPNVLDTQRLKFALISSNSPKKGVRDVIDIANILSESTPNAEFLIIGPDNNFIQEQKELQRLGKIGDNVQFFDYQENNLEAVKLTNVVLSLSHCQETFARTVIEGMAARRPVVAYGWGALPELVTHESNGYLTPPLDAVSAAQFIHKLACAPEILLAFGERGRDYVMRQHSSESMQIQIQASLKSLIDFADEKLDPETVPVQKPSKRSNARVKGSKKKR